MKKRKEVKQTHQLLAAPCERDELEATDDTEKVKDL